LEVLSKRSNGQTQYDGTMVDAHFLKDLQGGLLREPGVAKNHKVHGHLTAGVAGVEHFLAAGHVAGMIGPANDRTGVIDRAPAILEHGTGLKEGLELPTVTGVQGIVQGVGHAGRGQGDGVQDVDTEGLVAAVRTPLAALHLLDALGE